MGEPFGIAGGLIGLPTSLDHVQCFNWLLVEPRPFLHPGDTSIIAQPERNDLLGLSEFL